MLTKVSGDLIGQNTVTNQNIAASVQDAYGWRNRIINGDMRIDQRNNGAAVSISGLVVAYTLDRWSVRNDTEAVVSVQQVSTAPTGFNSSLLYTVTTADTSLGATQNHSIQQRVEGFNMADFGWGTAAAQTVTLSFWVRSSLTGTFGGAISNSAANRSYPFTYTISAANTFEYKTITIDGDTTGTWLTTNGIGAYLYWSTGAGSTISGTAEVWAGSDFRSATGATSVVGTSGATFFITGVQLEAGSVATAFERRDFGRELLMCQRYVFVFRDTAAQTTINTGYTQSAVAFRHNFQVPVSMRAAPTVSAAGAVYFFDGIQNVQASSLSGVTTSTLVVTFTWNVPSATGQRPGVVYFDGAGNLTFNAEI